MRDKNNEKACFKRSHLALSSFNPVLQIKMFFCLRIRDTGDFVLVQGMQQEANSILLLHIVSKIILSIKLPEMCVKC